MGRPIKFIFLSLLEALGEKKERRKEGRKEGKKERKKEKERKEKERGKERRGRNTLARCKLLFIFIFSLLYKC